MLKITKTDYGYFACDKTTWVKIKRLHRWYQIAIQQAANWNRWHAKKPENRIIKIKNKEDGKTVVRLILPKPEPKLIPVFTKKEVITSYYKNGIYVPGGFQEERVGVCDMGILELYAAAKKPRSQIKNVPKTTHTTEEISCMLKEINASR